LNCVVPFRPPDPSKKPWTPLPANVVTVVVVGSPDGTPHGIEPPDVAAALVDPPVLAVVPAPVLFAPELVETPPPVEPTPLPVFWPPVPDSLPIPETMVRQHPPRARRPASELSLAAMEESAARTSAGRNPPPFGACGVRARSRTRRSARTSLGPWPPRAGAGDADRRRRGWRDPGSPW